MLGREEKKKKGRVVFLFYILFSKWADAVAKVALFCFLLLFSLSFVFCWSLLYSPERRVQSSPAYVYGPACTVEYSSTRIVAVV